MPSNPNNTTPVLTPDGNLAPSQQANPPGAQPYVDNGLTYQSNNPDFVERDANGNIIVNQGVDDNQNLVLEAVSLRYVNASVIRAIDTRFKYFKFPAENIAVPEISFESFGIDDLVDLVYAKYKPSENRIINSSNQYSGILMDQVLEGQPQLNTNRYTITPAITEQAPDGIRMRIRLAHRYTAIGIDLGNSYVQPAGQTDFVVKENWNNLSPFIRNSVITESAWNSFGGPGEYLIRFNKLAVDNNGDLNIAEALLSQNIQNIGGTQALAQAASAQIRSYYNSIFQNQAGSGTIYFSLIKTEFNTADIIRDFRELTVAAGNSTAIIDANITKISEYDITIPNEDFLAGDQFGIGVLVGQRVEIPSSETQIGRTRIHTIFESSTQWSITDASKNVDADNNEIE
jgi:hypothetical protein